MQLVNSAQFLNITFLLALFAAARTAAVLRIVIVTLIGIYASLQSHKLTLTLKFYLKFILNYQ